MEKEIDLVRFGGDPAPNGTNINQVMEDNPSLIEQVKLKAAETVQSFMLDMWLARQTQEKVVLMSHKRLLLSADCFCRSCPYSKRYFNCKLSPRSD
jgi:hypothetical protein